MTRTSLGAPPPPADIVTHVVARAIVSRWTRAGFRHWRDDGPGPRPTRSSASGEPMAIALFAVQLALARGVRYVLRRVPVVTGPVVPVPETP